MKKHGHHFPIDYKQLLITLEQFRRICSICEYFTIDNVVLCHLKCTELEWKHQIRGVFSEYCCNFCHLSLEDSKIKLEKLVKLLKLVKLVKLANFNVPSSNWLKSEKFLRICYLPVCATCKSEWARILGHFPIVQITQFGTGIAGQLLSVGNHVYYGMYPLFCFHLLQLLSPFVHSVSTFSLSFLFGQFFLLIVLHTIKHRYTLIHRHFYMCHYFVLYISF